MDRTSLIPQEFPFKMWSGGLIWSVGPLWFGGLTWSGSLMWSNVVSGGLLWSVVSEPQAVSS